MSSSSRPLTLFTRLLLGVLALTAAIMLAGPFQYAELMLPFDDKVAHGLLFYTGTLLSFIAFPRVRKGDLVRVALGLAFASEFAQGVTGRDVDWRDMIGDAAGVLLAAAPLYAAVIRYDLSSRRARQRDRRRSRQMERARTAS